MPNFVRFAAGKANDKRLKWTTVHPCLNGFSVHIPKCIRTDSE
jgi:hypothetical protein